MRPLWPWFCVFSLLACHAPEPDAPASSKNRIVIAPASSSSAAPARPASPKRQASDASDAVVARLRDPRLRRPPRATALLTTELTQLESLFGTMNTSAPDRLPMLRRLAEDYDELARTKRSEPASAGPSEDSERARLRVRAASLGAWERYQRWIAESHDDPATDEVLYHLALNLERYGKTDEARKTYFELIRRYPASRLVPATYLAFGELFFRASEQDPSQIELARQAYMKVAEYPPPDNKVYGLALVRIAQITARQGDPAETADARTRALEALTYEASTADKEELTRMLP